jgi:hypothetical protein
MNIFHLETKGQRRQHKPNLLTNSGLFSHLTQVIQMTSSTMLEMEDKKYQIRQKIATVSTHATKKNNAQLAAPTLQASTLKATCCNLNRSAALHSSICAIPCTSKCQGKARHGTARQASYNSVQYKRKHAYLSLFSIMHHATKYVEVEIQAPCILDLDNRRRWTGQLYDPPPQYLT